MKTGDIIFPFPAGIAPHARGICRVRSFVSAHGIVVLLTDLGDKNTGPSVTNAVEVIIAALVRHGTVVGEASFVEHYEPYTGHQATYDLVRISPDGHPTWESLSAEQLMTLAGCDQGELDSLAVSDARLVDEIERIRNSIDPFIDSPWPEDPKVTTRRLDIATGMVSKKEVFRLVSSGGSERSLQRLLKTDLSFFGELYGHPHDEYICFSEFPIADGFCDFAVFTGRSRMDIVLIEVKGADFDLVNRDSYMGFSRKVNQAADQIRTRLGHIFRDYHRFRSKAHRIRSKAEAGKSTMHGAFLGPEWRLQVDPKKDVHIRAVVIGGRSRDDLAESTKRHDYETRFSPPIKIESWDTVLRKLRRQ